MSSRPAEHPLVGERAESSSTGSTHYGVETCSSDAVINPSVNKLENEAFDHD